MQLPEHAAQALARIRSEGRGVRFEIRKACEQERWRLKVCWAPAQGGAEAELGLLWSEDLAGLQALRRTLEEGG
ncbi:MAG TPA: hypothetical protein VFM53_01850 [Anaeromyxobacteraceae bacterium]|nr:hypothetical protein [Anaeromyxobacteraceae bacterium]